MTTEEELIKEREKQRSTSGFLSGLGLGGKILFFSVLIGGFLYYQYVNNSKVILILGGAILAIMIWQGYTPKKREFTIGELRILADRELQTMSKVQHIWGPTGNAWLTAVDIPLYVQKAGETELGGWVIGVEAIDKGQIPRHAAIIMDRHSGERLAFKYTETELTGREQPFEIKRILGSEIVDLMYGKRMAQDQYGQDLGKR